MACCGGKRRSYPQPSPRPAVGGAGLGAQRTSYRRPAAPQIFFEYVGEKAMTVIGSVSGRRYRFASPGAVVAVDGRDSTSIAAVPGLRRVSR